LTNIGYEFHKLPDSWIWVKTGDICEGLVPGRTKPKSFNGDIPWITLPDIDDLYVSRSKKKLAVDRKEAESVGMKVMPKNTVLMSCVGQFGLICITSTQVVPNQQLHGFICLDKVLPEYIAYALKTQVHQMEQMASATTISYLNKTKCNSIKIPLPPLNEQHRIVTKIEALTARSRKARAALDAIPALLDQFRQSVLAAAFRGDLTADWRAQNPDVEPAEKLVVAAETNKVEILGKYKKPKSLDIDELPSLPKTWTWSIPQTLSSHTDNSICAGPFGTIFKAKDFRDSGIPIIFLRHVAPGKYLNHKPGFMDSDKWEELFKPYSVWGGELLITKLGEPPGTCAIFPKDKGPAMVTPDVIKMTVNPEAVQSHYLMHYFNSELSRKIAFGVAYGVTRLRMNLSIFRALPVPLAPLEEQVEICRQVQYFFDAIEVIESQYKDSLQQLDQLDQSILAKAFRGQLVPQDPNDEPASVLLERIRTEREKTQKKKRKGKGKK